MSKSGKQKKIEKQTGQEQKVPLSDIDNTGNYLRTLRLGKGLSTSDITEATRISEKNIKAIEDHNFSSLPADTFTRGLLNIYANFLGADSEAITAKFMEERHKSPSQKKRTKAKQPNKLLTPKRLAEPARVSSMTMAGILLLIIIVSFAGYCIYTSWNPFSFLLNQTNGLQSVMETVLPHEETSASDESEGQTVTVPSEPATDKAFIPPSPLTEEKSIPETSVEVVEQTVGPTTGLKKSGQDTNGYEVKLRFPADTRIELKQDEDETVSLEFTAGDTHTLNAESTLELTFSQPDSAEILVNETKIAFPELRDGNYTLKIPQDLAQTQPDE